VLEHREGLAKFCAPLYDTITSRNEVFYNPLMRLNRDLSVLHASTLAPGRTILDGMAGTGIRSLRYMLESGHEVHANDLNPQATALIEHNMHLNDVTMRVTQADFNVLEGKYDIIEVDPFGSPVRYLNPALRLLKKEGLLFVTATDTAALCGASYAACRRKYGARPLRVSFCHEVGLRILVGYLVQQAAAWGYGLTPLLSYVKDHYMRVQARVLRGKKRADASIDQIGILNYCPRCSERLCTATPRHQCACGTAFEHAYPLWCGSLHEGETIDAMLKELPRSCFDAPEETEAFLRMLKGESSAPFFWDSHDLCARIGVQVLPLAQILEQLTAEGFEATRTHFSPMGFRTDAHLPDLVRVLASGTPYR
jgi:tRNA (guanine26-N2/guanine27-N2)-dimethyltransferase